MCDFPFKDMLKFHKDHGREGTIVVSFCYLRVGKGGCHARFTGFKIKKSRLTGIKTDFSRFTHNSAFDFHGSREINSFFHD